jgi:hypothetical protein
VDGVGAVLHHDVGKTKRGEVKKEIAKKSDGFATQETAIVEKQPPACEGKRGEGERERDRDRERKGMTHRGDGET